MGGQMQRVQHDSARWAWKAASSDQQDFVLPTDRDSTLCLTADSAMDRLNTARRAIRGGMTSCKPTLRKGLVHSNENKYINDAFILSPSIQIHRLAGTKL
jgi:hypothetical protein